MTIQVFMLDDIEWWAGESLEACVKAAREQAGEDCYEDDGLPDGPLSDETMQKLKFIDEDEGVERTFTEELARLIAAGVDFPCLFAATDW